MGKRSKICYGTFCKYLSLQPPLLTPQQLHHPSKPDVLLNKAFEALNGLSLREAKVLICRDQVDQDVLQMKVYVLLVYPR